MNTPWKWKNPEIDVNKEFNSESLIDVKGNIIAYGGQCQWEGNIVISNPAHAAFIVRAVNCHKELVKTQIDAVLACKKAIKYLEKIEVEDRIASICLGDLYAILPKIEQALAKAEAL